MREIKFRAWDRDHGKMVFPNEQCTTGTLIDWFEDEDLMQYTGLKDRNGKEIYEGDVVNVYEDTSFESDCTRCLVLLGESNFEVENYYGYTCYIGYTGVYLKPLIKIQYPFTDKETSRGRAKYWEIIGNVHENPELLK